MTDTHWTPGPWRVGELDVGTDERYVEAGHYSICKCHHHCVGSIQKAMEANARLIAAAPEMAEALETFVTFFEKAMEGFTPGYEDRQVAQDAVAWGWNDATILFSDFFAARAALAKALGQSDV